MTERQILWSGNESYLSSGGDSEKHALRTIIHLKENNHCNGVCGTFGKGEHGGDVIKLYLGNSIDMSLDNSPVGGGEGEERGEREWM